MGGGGGGGGCDQCQNSGCNPEGVVSKSVGYTFLNRGYNSSWDNRRIYILAL